MMTLINYRLKVTLFVQLIRPIPSFATLFVLLSPTILASSER